MVVDVTKKFMQAAELSGSGRVNRYTREDLQLVRLHNVEKLLDRRKEIYLVVLDEDKQPVERAILHPGRAIDRNTRGKTDDAAQALVKKYNETHMMQINAKRAMNEIIIQLGKKFPEKEQEEQTDPDSSGIPPKTSFLWKN